MTQDARMDQITPTTPLLLEEAAKIAFPGGNMTALILRRQAAKGNLTIEKIGNRVYTTLADVEEMRKRCRVNPKGQGSGSTLEPARTATGSSRTPGTSVNPPGYGLAVAEALRQKFKTASPKGKSRGKR